VIAPSLGDPLSRNAHEIKTARLNQDFCQLCRSATTRTDFRETFSSLIVHEIDRIDSLVNQAASFRNARQNHCSGPMHVHEVLEKTFARSTSVVSKGDQTHPKLEASRYHPGWTQSMEQVFLNFFPQLP